MQIYNKGMPNGGINIDKRVGRIVGTSQQRISTTRIIRTGSNPDLSANIEINDTVPSVTGVRNLPGEIDKCPTIRIRDLYHNCPIRSRNLESYL
jgi:hypothetical protein